MKSFVLLGFITAALSISCQYSPLDEVSLRIPEAGQQSSKNKLRATYLGNTTIYITDGKTHLLVDGFLSRPPAHRLFLGHYCSDKKEIEEQLEAAKIDNVDAVLVAHTHGDHALDAPYYAKYKGATVMGTNSYSHIHNAANAPAHLLHDVSLKGKNTLDRGKFKITFLPSDHIPATGYRKLLEENINDDFRLPAHFTKYKCGPTYAIHIAHPDGNIAITTSAGSKLDQWQGLKADVLFLGIGLLSKRPSYETITYWKQAVEPLAPKTVVAAHWDNFSKKLPTHDTPRHKLSVPPLFMDRPKTTMNIMKRLAAGETQLRVMDLRETISLR